MMRSQRGTGLRLASGAQVRRLLPFVGAFIAVLSLLRWEGQRLGLYGTAVGIVLVGVGATGLISGLLWHLADSLDGSEATRERLAALVESSDDSIIGTTPDGIIEIWNRGAEALYGYTRDEALGAPVGMLVPAGRADEVAQILAQVRSGKSVEPIETVRLTKTGTPVDVSLRVSVVHDARGELTGVASITRDITAQKLIERELQATARYFELSTDLTCTAGFDGFFKHVNPALPRILGWSPEEFVGRPFIDMVHPDDREATLHEVEKLAQGQVTFHFLNRYEAKDGSYRWLDWNAIASPEEELMYCAGRDVTDRKLAEAALAASERQTRQILETAHDSFVAIDADGMIIDWNPQAEAMFGWPRADALGRELAATIIPTESRDAHRLGLERFVTTGETRVMGKLLELSAVHRDGREFPVELTISPVKSDHGYSFNAFIRDISERRRTQHELALARDQALEASRMKSMFVANVSHEIRTPMNGVIGMSELLLDTELSEEQREYADTIASSGETLLDVIDDILDFSKIEAGKLDLDPTDFDLRLATERACGMLSARASAKELELLVSIDPEVPSLVHGDAARLRQVIANFVSNAIKFTAEGSVDVRVSSSPREGGAALVRIAVSDTGVGIEPEALARLFKPFSQADTSTTRRYGGTGLGLAISKELIELMDGTIGADSEVGKGSCFWCEILFAPATGGKRSGSRDGSAAGLIDGRGSTARGSAPPTVERDARLVVLIVEDTPINQMVAVRMVEKLGYRAVVAENGRKALQALAASPYAAVLMDCQMPELDGYEATREIRRSEEPWRRTPVIAMTANSMRGERERCLAAGMNDYLSKPLRSESLHDVLAHWASRPASAAAVDHPSSGERAASAPAAGPALLDRAAIAGLAFDGDVLGETLSLYFDQADSQIFELSSAISRGETLSVAQTAHRLRDSSSTVGAAHVSRLASELEAVATAENLTPAPALLRRLRAGLDDTKRAFASV